MLNSRFDRAVLLSRTRWMDQVLETFSLSLDCARENIVGIKTFGRNFARNISRIDEEMPQTFRRQWLGQSPGWSYGQCSFGKVLTRRRVESLFCSHDYKTELQNGGAQANGGVPTGEKETSFAGAEKVHTGVVSVEYETREASAKYDDDFQYTHGTLVILTSCGHTPRMHWFRTSLKRLAPTNLDLVRTFCLPRLVSLAHLIGVNSPAPACVCRLGRQFLESHVAYFLPGVQGERNEEDDHCAHHQKWPLRCWLRLLHPAQVLHGGRNARRSQHHPRHHHWWRRWVDVHF